MIVEPIASIVLNNTLVSLELHALHVALISDPLLRESLVKQTCFHPTFQLMIRDAAILDLEISITIHIKFFQFWRALP